MTCGTATTDLAILNSNGMTKEGAAFIVAQTKGGSGTRSSSSSGTTAEGSAATESPAAATSSSSTSLSRLDLLGGGSSWFGGKN
jgi:hypothetical protein